VPCKLEFPHLVEMHRKYEKEGLVVLAASFDNPGDKEARDEIEAFLKKKGATFLNFVLENDADELYKTLDIPGPPCLYLFNRENRFVKKMVGADQIDFQVVEAEIARMLKSTSAAKK
jgi:hypothetical protein